MNIKRRGTSVEETLTALSRLINKPVKFILNEEEGFFEGKTYEIYEDGNEELLAICVLGSSNQLTDFHYVDINEPGDLINQDMPAIAETFIKAFYPHALEKYALQSVIDLDEIYIVTYGIKDEKFGLELQGLGFSVTISTNGTVVQFSYDGDEPTIIYPIQMITEEEAKEKYGSLIDFDLVIKQTVKDTYVNGDNTYRLVYALKEAAFDIPASGDNPATIEEGNQYEAIQRQGIPPESIYELIGVTENHVKLGELVNEEIIIEKWMHSYIERPEDVDFTEEYSDQMITIHFDRESNLPTFIYNGEKWQGEEVELDNDLLRKRALDFLYKVFPQAHEHFLIEIEDVLDYEADMEDIEEDVDYEVFEEWDEEDLDELDEFGEEESIAFYFHYHVNQIRVEEKVTCIQVGISSGNIISASVELVNKTLLKQIQTTPILSKDEARDRFMRKLQMELSMSLEFDEDGNTSYYPTYLPSFPETIGHVHMIDAENGKTYYVDIGETVFFTQ